MTACTPIFDPHLTYITPVFNGEGYIQETLDSIAQQVSADGSHYQHIIVDDGSTDKTVDIVLKMTESSQGRITLIRQSNSGEASAVNTGVTKVTTPYFCIVNADDPLLPTHGQLMTEGLQNCTEIVVGYPDWLMIDQRGRVLRTVVSKDYSKKALIGDFVCLPGPGAVVRKDALVGDLRDTRYRYISDFESWIRLSARGEFKRIPKVLATWRQHDSGATAKGSGLGIANELLRLANDDLEHVVAASTFSLYQRSARSHAYYYAALHLNSVAHHGSRRLMFKSLWLKPYPSIGYETDHRHVFGIISVLLGSRGAIILGLLTSLRRRRLRD